MLEFYGSPMSSAGRTHWMLEEVGVPYDYKRIDIPGGGTRTEAFLAMYGAGKVPVIRDGERVLGESMAINLYLAEKYKPELLPDDAFDRARVYQWSFWALSILQPDTLTIMFDAMRPLAEREPRRVEAAKLRLQPQLAYLESALADSEYLVAGRFGVADVNVGSVINLVAATGLLDERHPRTTDWLARLKQRPAYQRAMGTGSPSKTA